MKIYIFFFLILLASTSTVAEPVSHRATLVHVIDAATYALDVHLDGEIKRINVSLSGLSVPKIYGPTCEREAAQAAKIFVKNILLPNEPVKVSNIHLKNARLTGQIEFDGRDLADILIRFKQARPDDFSGSWCSAGAYNIDGLARN